MDVTGDDMLQLYSWEFKVRLSWGESFFEDDFISSVEDGERDEVLHNPYDLDDSFCDIIYKIEDEFIQWINL